MTPTSAREISAAWKERELHVVPGGFQTRAKDPARWDGVPRFADRARDGHVWDLDGTEWIDFSMALGAVLLGYTEPVVLEAITRQVSAGISFTLPHRLEVEVAERIVALCPGVEAVRYAKTGSEATAAAVRLARACTGRERVIGCGYHGWHDWCARADAAGVPGATRRLTSTLRYGDLDGLSAALADRDVAAVVIDPAADGKISPEFLHKVVSECARAGTVSVFDEAITGFRVAPGGVREKYGIRPDVSCYGKALGNGMPIAAVAGSWSVMADFPRTGVSGTYAGETLSLAAARAVLDILADGSVLSRVGALGEELARRLRESVARHGLSGRISIEGWPTRPLLVLGTDDSDKIGFQAMLAARSILCYGPVNLCAQHTLADIVALSDAFDGACGDLTDAHDT